jgi:hypothetical protein
MKNYIPLAVKAVFAEMLAEACIEQRGTRWVLNAVKRELAVAAVLLKHYLCLIEKDNEYDITIDVEQYDQFIGKEERLMIPEDVADDLGKFVMILDVEIGNFLAVKNDRP